MFDLVNEEVGPQMADVARRWSSSFFKDKLVFRKESDQSIRAVAAFFDPQLEWCAGVEEGLLGMGSLSGLLVSWYLLPLNPDLAKEMYEAAVTQAGWRCNGYYSFWNALPKFLSASFSICYQIGLCLAIEFGDDVVADRLRAVFECVGEGREFDDGCFGYFFHLGEKWPRGMMSANLVITDVLQKGAWQRIFKNKGYRNRFTAPTITSVDFPKLGISQAFNDSDAGALIISTYVGVSIAAGQTTSFKVVNLPQSSRLLEGWEITCDGVEMDAKAQIILSESSLELHVDIAERTYTIKTGFAGRTGL